MINNTMRSKITNNLGIGHIIYFMKRHLFPKNVENLYLKLFAHVMF